MSKETVQFVEMVRQAVVQNPPALTILMFCANCATERRHTFVDETALDERYRCVRCRCIKVVRVR